MGKKEKKALLIYYSHAHFSCKDSFSIPLTFPLSRRHTPRTEFWIHTMLENFNIWRCDFE